jgi:NIPSNAP protein
MHNVLLRSGAVAIACLLTPAALTTQGDKPAAAAAKVVELRSYNLKPGTRDRFHKLFLAQALPMLNRWKVDVVGYGPSLHDSDSYFLMRAFPSVEERQKSEDVFYGSEEWKQGPREAILADIVSYTTIVMQVDEPTLAGLRRMRGR